MKLRGILGRRDPRRSRCVSKQKFIDCLGPAIALDRAELCWRRYLRDRRLHTEGNVSFMTVYEFVEDICLVHELDGQQRRRLRHLLSRVHCPLPSGFAA